MAKHCTNHAATVKPLLQHDHNPDTATQNTVPITPCESFTHCIAAVASPLIQHYVHSAATIMPPPQLCHNACTNTAVTMQSYQHCNRACDNINTPTPVNANEAAKHQQSQCGTYNMASQPSSDNTGR